ncbi:MAG: mechanosensitive ion channel [Caenibius sp.]
MSIGNYRFNPDLAVEIGEKALVAVAILIATWLLAKAAQWAFTQLVSKIAFLRQATGTDASIGESLGRIVSLLIWLLGLLAILQVLSLGGVMGPVETLLNNVMGFIPRLVGAGLIFFIGMFVARIARDITVTALQTVDFDKWANKGGVDSVTGNNAISKTLGTIVYILIIIPVAIAALEALNLTTVSEPASDMLRMILGAVPNVLGGAILLGIGYVISRFAAQMLREVLPGLGVDRSIASADILPEGTTASALIARIAQIAIVLFFAIAATRILGFAELTAILDKVLELGGRVIFGSVVIVAGFFIAGLIARLVSGAGQNPLAASIVRWTASVLFTFMGLQFMGVGEEIVEIAFAALVIGTAVAGALAFGLGGREWAARKLDQIDRKD